MFFRKSKDRSKASVEEYRRLIRRGVAPTIGQYVARYPDCKEALRKQLREYKWIATLVREAELGVFEAAASIPEEELENAWQRFRSATEGGWVLNIEPTGKRMLRQIRRGISAFRQLKQRDRLGSEHVGANLVSLINWIGYFGRETGMLNSRDIENELRQYLIELRAADDSLKEHAGYKSALTIDKEAFLKILQLLLDYTPFVEADIARMLEVSEATLTMWSSGNLFPHGGKLVKLSDILLGIDEKVLFSNKPFVASIPRGEQRMLPYVQCVVEATRKSACSVYRYNPKDNAFVIAAYFGYGRTLKTKVRYRVASEHGLGDGITGNIMRIYNGQLIVPTRRDQIHCLPNRSTKDEGAFLAMFALQNGDGRLLGCVKVEDSEDGSVSDINSGLRNDILAMGRMYVKCAGDYEYSGQWWK